MKQMLEHIDFVSPDNRLYKEYGIPAVIVREVQAYTPTGSSFTCDPPVSTTDKDVLLFVTMDAADLRNHFYADGWDVHEDYHNTDSATEIKFLTARRGLINVIAYTDRIGYERFAAATRICKEFNFMDKKDRVRAHIAATETL